MIVKVTYVGRRIGYGHEKNGGIPRMEKFVWTSKDAKVGKLNLPVELFPKDSQELRNHSPNGFEWGYTSSGSDQLALAILLDCTNKDIALRYYRPFSEYAIINAPKEGFNITSSHIKAWINGVSGGYYSHV